MQIYVDKSSPLLVKEQIKRQIRALITSGEMQDGLALPSAKDLAAFTAVNRNTVALAYKELAAEGFLKTVKGSGTFVKGEQKTTAAETLQPIFDEAFDKAKTMGFTPDQVTDVFFNRLAVQNTIKDRCVMAVWCNEGTIREARQILETDLGVETRGLLLQDLEQYPEKAENYFAGVDLVFSSLSYVEEIQTYALPPNVEVVGVMLTPVTEILNEIMRWPSGTKVGFCCMNDRAAESTWQSVRLSGGSTLNSIWAGTDDSRKFMKLIAKCQVIFATQLVYDQVCKAAGPNKRVIYVDASPKSEHVDLVRQRLSHLV